jgi:signal transduction histidine kinase
MIRRATRAFAIRLLLAMASYLLATILYISVTALVAGYREGVLASDQYFNSHAYRRQVEMDLAAMIQVGGEDTEAWAQYDLPDNLYAILVKDKQILYSNIPDIVTQDSLGDAVRRLEQIAPAGGVINATGYYTAGLSFQVVSVEYFAAVDRDLPYLDTYSAAARQFSVIKPYMKLSLKLILPVALLFLFLVAMLVRTSGQTEPGASIQPTFIDRIYGDVFTGLTFLSIYILASSTWMYSYGWVFESWFDPIYSILIFAVLFLPVYLIGLVWFLSLCRRIRLNTWLKHNLTTLLLRSLFGLLQRLFRFLNRLWRNLPLIVSTLTGFIVYLFVNAILIILIVLSRNAWFVALLLLYNGAVGLYLCHLSVGFSRIAATARSIAAGFLGAKTELTGLGGRLKTHGEVVNRIGDGLTAEVTERVKSEKFKTELIANVSHDIRTPLTAIINYVDLLRKQSAHSPAAEGYLTVLDRNAQRLKVLTDDLLDLSRFSTGNVHLNMERLDIRELIHQGVGEYSEKMAARQLRLVLSLPEMPVLICADGRHLWRILENLLSNVCKYAQPHSRVYIDLVLQADEAVWVQRNVSEQPLNISPEALMERFVRGDDARNTEGSGLGLSIARSLVELQGGRFDIQIDGDLFKTTIRFARTDLPEDAPV